VFGRSVEGPAGVIGHTSSDGEDTFETEWPDFGDRIIYP
jgi:hypothetical protein